MKKIILTSLAAVLAIGTANAEAPAEKMTYKDNVFSPTYRVAKGEFSGTFGIAYSTAIDSDFKYGDTNVGDVNLSYGVMDNISVTLETANDAHTQISTTAKPTIGVNWQFWDIMPELKMDMLAKWGVALSDVGLNNFQAGLHLYGEMEEKFQYGARILAQYVDSTEIWSLLAQAEVQYEFNKEFAIKAEGLYDVNAISEDINIYDRSVSLGMIYSMTDYAAVMPYAAYHFEDVIGSDDADIDLANQYWQLGARFGVQF